MIKARLVLKLLLDTDDEVDVEFNLIKNAVQEERVCHTYLTSAEEVMNSFRFVCVCLHVSRKLCCKNCVLSAALAKLCDVF